MPDLNAYIVKETAINAVINTALGMVVFVVLFRGQDRIALWGLGGIVMDCVPQGFMVGLMSVLPPSVLTRIRIAKGTVAGDMEPVGKLLRRALLCAVATMLCLTLLAASLALLSGATDFGFVPGLTLKALASFVLVCIITPPAVRMMLRKAQ